MPFREIPMRPMPVGPSEALPSPNVPSPNAPWSAIGLLAASCLLGLVGRAAAQEREPEQEPEQESAAGIAWRTDTPDALREAQQQGRSLLLHFSGTDWSKDCQRLIAEVFQQPAFADLEDRHLVLLRVDFPRVPGGQTDEVREANEALQERYRVTRYPSVFLADPEGRAFARFGTRAFLGPESFLKAVEQRLPILGRRDAAWRDGDVSEAEGLAAGLEAIDPSLWRHYRSELERIVGEAPANGSEAVARFRDALKGLEAEDAVPALMEEVQRLFGQGRMGDAVRRIEDFLGEHRGLLAAGLQQTLLYSKAGLCARVGDFEGALAAIDAAVAVDPETALAEQLRALRQQLAGRFRAEGDGKK